MSIQNMAHFLRSSSSTQVHLVLPVNKTINYCYDNKFSKLYTKNNLYFLYRINILKIIRPQSLFTVVK